MSTLHNRRRSSSAVRILITGGPGTGKSTLLAALAAAGEVCFEEASRTLIREQLASDGRKVPWGDLWDFAQECSVRMRDQIDRSAAGGVSFFDRGLPDLMGYLAHGGQHSPNAWQTASHVYARVAFFAPPWSQIFVNDPERPQSFSEACALSSHIRAAYESCGITLVELDRAAVNVRVAQVLNHLGANQYHLRHG